MSDICGIPLDHQFPDDAVFLRGIAIVQALDGEGNLRLWVSSTGGLGNGEALALVNQVRDRLMEVM